MPTPVGRCCGREQYRQVLRCGGGSDTGDLGAKFLDARGAGGPSAGASGHRGGSESPTPKINENPLGLAPRNREVGGIQRPQ